MKFSEKISSLLVVGSLFSCIHAANVYAGAAYIYELGNSTDTGFGGAGLSARAGDAGTVFSNPAGMTRFNTNTILGGVTAVYLHAPFDPDEDNTVQGPRGNTNEALGGGSFAYIYSLTDDLKLGVSAQNFFGLGLDWHKNWVGRYASVDTMVFAPQVQPTIAYQLTDWLSIGGGAGLTMGYLKDKFMIDKIGTDVDGSARYEDTDFTVQGNFGIMFEPTRDTRFGFRYLTKADLDFKDKIKTSNLNPPNSNTTTSITTPAEGIKIGLRMPQAVMAGAYHQFNDKLALLGSFGWDDWSDFSYVKLGIVNTTIDTEVNAGFKDVWHYGIGAEYQLRPDLKLTTGFSYDSSMSNKYVRPIMIPLGAMRRFAFGYQYKQSDDLTLGGGFSLLLERDLPIKTASGGLTGQVSGKYKAPWLAFFSFYAQWQ